MRRLLYHWASPSDGAKIHRLALGCGSLCLYNHANPANMRYEAMQESNVLRFAAVRTIEAGEELTSKNNAVGGEHPSQDDVWFSRMGVTPL